MNIYKSQRAPVWEIG